MFYTYKEYEQALEIVDEDYSFAGMLMAAMMKASTNNLLQLKGAFPDMYDEWIARRKLPGGMTPEEKQHFEMS